VTDLGLDVLDETASRFFLGEAGDLFQLAALLDQELGDFLLALDDVALLAGQGLFQDQDLALLLRGLLLAGVEAFFLFQYLGLALLQLSLTLLELLLHLPLLAVNLVLRLELHFLLVRLGFLAGLLDDALGKLSRFGQFFGGEHPVPEVAESCAEDHPKQEHADIRRHAISPLC